VPLGEARSRAAGDREDAADRNPGMNADCRLEEIDLAGRIGDPEGDVVIIWIGVSLHDRARR